MRIDTVICRRIIYNIRVYVYVQTVKRPRMVRTARNHAVNVKAVRRVTILLDIAVSVRKDITVQTRSVKQV